VERRHGQRGGGLEQHIGVVLVIASPRHRSIIIVAAADSHAREECGLELAISSSPRPPVWGARGVESPTSSSRPSEAVGGATGSSPPTFRRLQPPRLGLPADAPVAGEVDRLGVDAERATGGGFQRRPAAPSVIAYPGRSAPDLHISLVTGRGQGSTPVAVGSEDQPPSSWGSTAPPLRR
jgi:hypothetical protein